MKKRKGMKKEKGVKKEKGGEKQGDEEVEGGEKVSLAIAVVLPIERETSKKERVVVGFSTLTRSARKRQQEEMMKDVESQIDSNRNKGEVMETPSVPVTGAPVTTKAEGAPVKSAVEKKSSVPVTTGPEGAPVMTNRNGTSKEYYGT